MSKDRSPEEIEVRAKAKRYMYRLLEQYVVEHSDKTVSYKDGITDKKVNATVMQMYPDGYNTLCTVTSTRSRAWGKLRPALPKAIQDILDKKDARIAELEARMAKSEQGSNVDQPIPIAEDINTKDAFKNIA